jgi:hypothetical protein
MAFKVFSTAFVSKIYSVYPSSYHERDSAAVCPVFGTSGDSSKNKFVS